ncbi:hypothetical protein TNCV_4353341 [Trichonephila clavipes]|nr:hypothetical protein TNCV_4353341 [Trichonephila clavipes]
MTTPGNSPQNLGGTEQNRTVICMVLKSASKLGISRYFGLYQDNDPKYTADICKFWVFYPCPSVIKTPALGSSTPFQVLLRSPDLNSVEHL